MPSGGKGIRKWEGIYTGSIQSGWLFQARIGSLTMRGKDWIGGRDKLCHVRVNRDGDAFIFRMSQAENRTGDYIEGSNVEGTPF